MKKISAVLCCILLTACSWRSPDSSFYVMESSGLQPISGKKTSVSVARVKVPDMLDRPQIIVSDKESTQIQVLEFERWGETYPDMLQGTITNDLIAYLPNAYVKPLTVELQILKTKHISEVIHLSKQEVEVDMKGDLKNIRSYAVYRVSQIHDCDVIVAATFNIRTVSDGYEINVIGFPANFVNWKTATQADYEWIKFGKIYTTSEFEKISPVIKK